MCGPAVLQVAPDRRSPSNVLYVDRQLVERISTVRNADGGMGLGFPGGLVLRWTRPLSTDMIEP
jgi:hypothetical protein